MEVAGYGFGLSVERTDSCALGAYAPLPVHMDSVQGAAPITVQMIKHLGDTGCISCGTWKLAAAAMFGEAHSALRTSLRSTGRPKHIPPVPGYFVATYGYFVELKK